MNFTIRVEDVIEQLDGELKVTIFNDADEVSEILIVPSMTATLKNERLAPARKNFIKKYQLYNVVRIYVKDNKLGMWIDNK